MKIVKIKLKDLQPTEENPNVMSENKFNALVKAIEELGYDQPIKVWFNSEIGKYEIVKGNHRYWALKTLGYTDEDEIECVVGEYENRDQMLRDMVRDNIVRGKLDPIKFTQLYEKISRKYGKELTREMFSFLEEEELNRLYKEIREQLPPELRRKLEEAKEEIRTIDDLSKVLNEIFSKYGDTLQWNFMVFDYLKGGKIMYIRASKENWEKLQQIAKYCVDNQKDINEVIRIEMSEDL